MQKYYYYYYVGYVKLNSLKPLHLLVNKMNEYVAESNGNKYFSLVPGDESKDTLDEL